MLNTRKQLKLSDHMSGDTSVRNFLERETDNGDELRTFFNNNKAALSGGQATAMNNKVGYYHYPKHLESEIDEIYTQYADFFEKYVGGRQNAHLEAIIAEIKLESLQKQAINQMRVTLQKLRDQDQVAKIYAEDVVEDEEDEDL